MSEIYSIISGRVQMVMFRDFMSRKANSLGIVGTARNLDDGSVEVVAQGDKTQLEKLIDFMHKGSIFSRVDNVAVTWREPGTSFADFRILF
ncbi:MAG: acylphosphatase [Candidatus Paceibacterota bacterium]